MLRALTAVLVFLAALSGASQARAADEERPVVRLAYTSWSSSIASAHVVKAVLRERLDVRCELIRFEPDQMWRAVAEGRADVMLSAWLPTTHSEYYSRYAEEMVDLGPNLTGARIGLVVPDASVGRQTGPQGRRVRPYIEADSIPDLRQYADKFRHRIVGIDPQAGVMQRTREAMRAYGLDDFRLIDGSEISMTAELSHAIRHQQWIVVTGWTPHWMFGQWKLKFLEDPLGIYGGEQSIHTMVSKQLPQRLPQVTAFLDSFSWTSEEMGRYLVWNRSDNGLYPYEKALRWLKTHHRQVATWLEGNAENKIPTGD
ncbi:MAG: glycine betaine ABC transporter substrate-binding protein [Desulfuromonadales bacterium]